MELVVLVIHLVVCICLVGLVLLQRSEGGALGMGGGGGGSLVSGRGAADALAKMTSVAGGFFLVTSLSLTALSGASASTDSRSVFDLIPREERSAPAPAPTPAEPARPDPTQSNAPELADTQLAALTPAPAPAAAAPVAPAPVVASTRAAPLETSASPAATARPASTQPASAPATRTPAPVRQAAAPAAPAATPRATAPATTQPAAARTTTTTRAAAPAATTTPNRPLVLPNSSGASTGQAEGESVDLGDGVEAVRRERAGPDQ